MEPLYLDVHVIQTVPPANLNRDDAGSPKQAVYGGVRRARVSSQAWKRATRKEFTRMLPRGLLGTRTKRTVDLLAQRLREKAPWLGENALTVAAEALAPLGIKGGRKGQDTAYLLFVGHRQLDELASVVTARISQELDLSDADVVKQCLEGLPVEDVFGTGHPVDVALFGRMVADRTNLNVDAAAQVAHAVSTHPVEVEFDYFTAVDDEAPKDEPGAGMIGTVEFNSATLYRFATLGVHQLLDNLDGDVDTTLAATKAFLRAFVLSMPTGHQTTFAHHTVPEFAGVVVRDHQPVNLVSAFEEPVMRAGGRASASCDRLAREFLRVESDWGLLPVYRAACYALRDGGEETPVLVKAFGEPLPFDEVVARSVGEVEARLSAGEA